MSAFPHPLPATFAPSNDPVLLHAIVIAGSTPMLLAMFPDGSLKLVDVGEVNADFRYDFKSGEWVDVSWGEGYGQTGEEDDRGEGVSGHLSFSDRTGDRD